MRCILLLDFMVEAESNEFCLLSQPEIRVFLGHQTRDCSDAVSRFWL